MSKIDWGMNPLIFQYIIRAKLEKINKTNDIKVELKIGAEEIKLGMVVVVVSLGNR